MVHQANHILDGLKATSGMATKANDGILAPPNIVPKSNVEERNLTRSTWMNFRITMVGSLRSRLRIADRLCTVLGLLRPRRLRPCVIIISNPKSLRHLPVLSLSITPDAVRTTRQREARCPTRLLPPLYITNSRINNTIALHRIQVVAVGTTKAILAKISNNDTDPLLPLSNRSALAVQILAPRLL